MSLILQTVSHAHSSCDTDWLRHIRCLGYNSQTHETALLCLSGLSLANLMSVAYRLLDKSSKYEIEFGQTLKVKDKEYTVADDSASPRYGFRFETDVGGKLEVHQKFGTVADSTFTTEWYDSGTQDITWDPIFKVWFKSKTAEKLDVKFTNTLTQVIYCNSEGEWSLTGPHCFAAGKTLHCLSNLEYTSVLTK